MKHTKLFAFILALCLCLGLAACGSAGSASPSDLSTPAPATETPAPTPAATPAPTEEPQPEPEPDTQLPINIMVMNGATGFGMAKLKSDADKGEAGMNYQISVESDASNVTAALISGGVDIAVLPTNAAAAVYSKTEGGVQVAGEIVRGNLYLLQNTEKENIASAGDLAGKTVYAPAQNPTFIAGALFGADAVIDNTYAQPADLRTALAAGEVDLAVLPEPMVTIALSANENLAIALDLSALWRENFDGEIVLGCVAVRTAFAEEHPLELAAFLADYNASVDFVLANPETAGQLIEEAGIFAQAKVAEKAIPRCGLCFVTGDQMRGELGAYLEELFNIAPQAVGGAVPGENFYYTAG